MLSTNEPLPVPDFIVVQQLSMDKKVVNYNTKVVNRFFLSKRLRTENMRTELPTAVFLIGKNKTLNQGLDVEVK